MLQARGVKCAPQPAYALSPVGSLTLLQLRAVEFQHAYRRRADTATRERPLASNVPNDRQKHEQGGKLDQSE
jgi:hypothetical protein